MTSGGRGAPDGSDRLGLGAQRAGSGRRVVWAASGSWGPGAKGEAGGDSGRVVQVEAKRAGESESDAVVGA